MPPLNDNIEHATIITGLSGSIFTNNNGATTQSGETGWCKSVFNCATTASNSPYGTEWFLWQCPAAPIPTGPITTASYYQAPVHQEFLFSTKDDLTNFPTVVQIFPSGSASGSTAVQTVSEMTASVFGGIVLDERVGCNGGMSNHARVSFVADCTIPASGSNPMTSGSWYYIRVGGRNNQTGSFKLSWDMFDRMTLASCTQSMPTTVGVQWGSIYQDPTVEKVYYFPPSPLGIYQILWGGKNPYQWGGAATYTAGAPGTMFGEYSSSLQFYYTDYTNTTQSWVFPYSSQLSHAEAELFMCNNPTGSGLFYTCNTTVTMSFGDTFISDNIVPGVSWQLVQLFGSASFIEQLSVYPNGLINFSGGQFFGTFAYNSNIPITVGNITASLLNIDGISGASSPAHVTINPGHNNFVTFSFTANPTQSLTTANIEFSFCNTVVGTLVYPLYPIIAFSASFGGSQNCSSPTGHRREVSIFGDYTNNLYGDILLTTPVQYTASSSPQAMVSSASNCPAITQTTAASNQFSFDTQMPNIWIFESTSSTVVNTITTTATWGSVSLPPYTLTFKV